MKIVWLASYPLQYIESELLTIRNVGTGTGSWLINLALELSQNTSIDLHIITYSTAVATDSCVKIESITFHVLRYNVPFLAKGFPSFFRWDLISWYSSLVRRSIRLLHTINPDIVHAHGTEGPYSLIAYRSKYSAITSIQGIINEYMKVDDTPWFRMQAPIELFCLRENLNFGCRTHWDKEYVLNVNPDAKVHYMPEAVNPIFFNHIWIDPPSPSLLFVGNVSIRKGIGILLDALFLVNQIINTRLQIVGRITQRYKDELQMKLTKFGLTQQVEFLGLKSPHEIAVLLAQSSVYVLPTFMDNSPNSLCEAMAVGVPSIASSVGGVPSILTHEVDGLLVEAGQSKDLADAITRLLTDKHLRTTFSNKARSVAYSRNYPSNVARQTVAIYNQVIK